MKGLREVYGARRRLAWEREDTRCLKQAAVLVKSGEEIQAGHDQQVGIRVGIIGGRR